MEHRTFQTDIIYYSIETKNKIVYTYIKRVLIFRQHIHIFLITEF